MKRNILIQFKKTHTLYNNSKKSIGNLLTDIQI